MSASHPRRRFLASSLAVMTAATVGGRTSRSALAQAQTPSTRLRVLNITLPKPSIPIGTYVPAVRVANLLYVSGHGPALLPDGTRLSGKVGRDFTLGQGQAAARRVGLNVLATVQSTLGNLDGIVRMVKALAW